MPRRPPRNIKLAAALSERAQGRLLCGLFDAISVDGRCSLIARKLEPHLGFGLAQSWRDGHVTLCIAGWSSPVARQAHNLKVVGSNPTPATNVFNDLGSPLLGLNSVWVAPG